MHACIHTYIHTCMHAYIHTCMHACITHIIYIYIYISTCDRNTENKSTYVSFSRYRGGVSRVGEALESSQACFDIVMGLISRNVELQEEMKNLIRTDDKWRGITRITSGETHKFLRALKSFPDDVRSEKVRPQEIKSAQTKLQEQGSLGPFFSGTLLFSFRAARSKRLGKVHTCILCMILFHFFSRKL